MWSDNLLSAANRAADRFGALGRTIDALSDRFLPIATAKAKSCAGWQHCGQRCDPNHKVIVQFNHLECSVIAGTTQCKFGPCACELYGGASC